MGADPARWGLMAEKLVRLVAPSAAIDTNDSLIRTLGKNSETLQNITDSFVGLSAEFKMFFFFEELKTAIPGMSRDLVSGRDVAIVAGGVMHFGVDADASEYIDRRIRICCPRGPPERRAGGNPCDALRHVQICGCKRPRVERPRRRSVPMGGGCTACCQRKMAPVAPARAPG